MPQMKSGSSLCCEASLTEFPYVNVCLVPLTMISPFCLTFGSNLPRQKEKKDKLQSSD